MPAPAVIPARRAYFIHVAVKKLVVEFTLGARWDKRTRARLDENYFRSWPCVARPGKRGHQWTAVLRRLN